MEATTRIGPAFANSAVFLMLPAALTLAIGYYVALYPPHFAHPSQAAALQLSVLGPVLFLGLAGVFLSVASGMTPNPLSRDIGGQLKASVLSGLILGVAAFAADHASGFSQLIAGQLGIASIHIAFPESLYVYGAGAIVVECLYRLIPVAFLYALIARVLLAGRGEAIVFWILGGLFSLIEPLSQAPLAGAEPNLVWLLFAFIFAFNVGELALWRRYGWIAPLIARLSFYGTWHVALGPVLDGTLR